MIIKDTPNYKLHTDIDGVTGMIVQSVFALAEAKDLPPSGLASVGVSILTTLLLRTPPEIRARVKEKIKAGFLSALVDVEEHAAQLDAERL